MDFLRRNLAGMCVLVVGIGIVSEAWSSGSVQKFISTVRHEIAVHKNK